jgi:hypothetical protein
MKLADFGLARVTNGKVSAKKIYFLALDDKISL